MDSTKTFIFGGDLYIKQIPTIKPSLTDLFLNADYTFLNLEAPITDLKEHPAKTGPVLANSPTLMSNFFNLLPLTHFGLANNHLMDFGRDGLNDTLRFLEKNIKKCLGAGPDETKASEEITLGNVSILAVCEDQFGVAEKGMPGVFSLYSHLLISKLRYLKESGKLVIVYAHGGSENVPMPSPYILNRYRELIDQGADLVVGHHPHCIQTIEEYKNKKIYYSIGNFVHDYYPQSIGLVVKAEVKGQELHVSELPIQFKSEKLSLFNNTDMVNTYLKHSNKLTMEDYIPLFQTQSIYLFEQYYRRYLTGLFLPKSGIKIVSAIFKRKLLARKVKMSENERASDELMLLHLLRNNTHKEHIEMALKILRKETEDYRTSEVLAQFHELIDFIQNEQ